MKESENLSNSSRGRIIAKNTIYNLFGYGIPLIVAVAVIPKLINILGTERFGILNLVWIVIGYFSFFDLGIGRTLTKIIAEKISLNKHSDIPDVFWTSFIIMICISCVGFIILLILIPSLVNNYLRISENLKSETLNTFYVLAISVPLVSTTAGLRGVLEAYQKFGIINIIRTILGILTFLGPLITLLLVNSLFWVVVTLIVIRIIVWFLYFFECFKVNVNIRTKIKYNPSIIKPVFKLSLWITLANVVGPILIYSDRFIIGIVDSASAITYYATPYEIITKLLLIPGALVLVLFPIFSSSFNANLQVLKSIFLRSIKFIFLILYPIIFIVITFSYDILSLWLGRDFAQNSYLVLQILSIGVLLNGIAFIPFNFLQGVGKPEIPAILNSIELVFYFPALWLAIEYCGIVGAAWTWLSRIFIDTVFLLYFSWKTNIFNVSTKSLILILLGISVLLIIPFFLVNIYTKVLFAITGLTVFITFAWKFFLTDEEKTVISEKIKIRVS